MNTPERRSGGPNKCPTGPCSECTGPHHFSTEAVEFAIDERDDDEPEHEAAKLGHESWCPCKHCPAWILWEDLADDDEAAP